MIHSKGIHRYHELKLGKAAPQRDSRTLKFATLVKGPIDLPPEYDVDKKYPGAPIPMFANDR